VESDNEVNISGHIDGAAKSEEDLYYSVAQFSERGRRIEDVLPSHWLWADLDTVHPTVASKLSLHPTIAIESSPGRYQALWRLSEELKPSTLAKLNRALTYALDADPGGWDLTQVLRLPVTRNHKYPEKPFVKCMWYNEDVMHDPRVVWKKVKGLVPPEALTRAIEVVIERRDIPSALRRLLTTPVDQIVEGERSGVLWRLECGLAECGLTHDEIMDLVWPCNWNKWKAVGTGRARLEREIHKAIRHVQVSIKPPQEEEDEVVEESLPWIEHDSLVSMVIRKPRWMIEGVWSAGAQGIIAGEPKSSKSMIALALAVAVASGEPFLGKYRVKTQGPVLLVDVETGKRTTQDRLRRIEKNMGLLEDGDVVFGPNGTVEIQFPKDSGIPLHVLSEFPFDLTDEDHRRGLVDKVNEVQPVMVLLDSLYLMLGDVNENQAHELRPILLWLTEIKQQAGCSMPIVHHYKKENETTRGMRPGQRMRGSGALHAWTESAIFCTARKDAREGWSRTRLETEHRAAAPRYPFELAWTMTEDEGVGMSWEIGAPQTVQSRESGEKLNVVERTVGIGCTMPFPELVTLLGWSRKTVEKYVGLSTHLEMGMRKTRSGQTRTVRWV